MALENIVLVRHATSEDNEKGIIAGCELDSPLSNIGRLEARSLVEPLTPYLQDAVVYYSPMLRVRQTKNIVLNFHGIVANYPETRLLEQSVGREIAGMLREEAMKVPEIERFLHTRFGSYNGGESVDSMLRRNLDLFEDLKRPKMHQGAKNAVLFCHRGNFIAGEMYFNGLDFDAARAVRPRNAEFRVYSPKGF
jgi:broad specificity phosphatase PhoE